MKAASIMTILAVTMATTPAIADPGDGKHRHGAQASSGHRHANAPEASSGHSAHGQMNRGARHAPQERMGRHEGHGMPQHARMEAHRDGHHGMGMAGRGHRHGDGRGPATAPANPAPQG